MLRLQNRDEGRLGGNAGSLRSDSCRTAGTSARYMAGSPYSMFPHYLPDLHVMQHEGRISTLILSQKQKAVG